MNQSALTNPSTESTLKRIIYLLLSQEGMDSISYNNIPSYLFHYVSKIQGIGFRVSESVPSKSKDINP